MKKEVLLAIILGVLVALGITFFVYQKTKTSPTEATSPSPLATTAPINTLPEKETSPLEITFPENEAVFEDKAITITGRTTFANIPVVIFINQKDFLTQSDIEGNFSLDVNLESGGNVIVATIVDEQGSNHSQQIVAVYSNKSLEETLVSEEEIKDEK